MTTATWNGKTIAESTNTVVVEGNHYFPREAVTATLVPSDKSTVCPWKGTASYYSIDDGGEINQDAAWTYATPKDAAAEIRDHIAFWRGVTVTD